MINKGIFRNFLVSASALAFVMAGMPESAQAFPDQINEHEHVTADQFQDNLDHFLEPGAAPQARPKKAKKPKKISSQQIQKNKRKALKIKKDLRKLQVRAIQIETQIEKLRLELERNESGS